MPTFEELAGQITTEEAGPQNRSDETEGGNGSTGAAGTGNTGTSGTNSSNPGYVDLANNAQAPGIVTDGQYHYNINDASWTVDKWKNDPLTITIPNESNTLTDSSDPCVSQCEKNKMEAEEKCQAVRKRFELALEQLGCPSTITKKETESNNGCCACGTTTTTPATTTATKTTTNNCGCCCNSS